MIYDVIIADEEKNIPNTTNSVNAILGVNVDNRYKTHNSIEGYDVDLDTYSDIYNVSTRIKENVENGKMELGVYDKLNEDMFLSLFKYQPKIVKESTMHKSTIINNKIMKKLVVTDEFKKLRGQCRLDEFNSMLGTEALGEVALDIISEWKKEISEQLEKTGANNPLDDLDDLISLEDKLDDLMTAKESAKELLDDLIANNQNGLNNGAISNVNNAINTLNNDIDDIIPQIDAYSKDLDDLIKQSEQSLNDVAEKMAQAISPINEMLTNVTDQLSSWGLDGGMNKIHIPHEAKRMAMEKIQSTPKLKKLTNLLGKMRSSAIKEQKTKSKDSGLTINSVTIGNNISRTLPSAKMKLCNDVTKKDFYRQYNQKELMEYKMGNSSTKNKGPIVCCIDTSGSMNGSREVWSKAVALSMLEIAHSQKRDFAAIMFSSRADDPIVISKNEINPNKIIAIGEEFSNGGTDFKSPGRKSLELIKTSKFKKADIVFITDGDCDIDRDFVKKFNQEKENRQFRVVSILINTRDNVSDKTLKLFSDDIKTLDKVSDLTKADSNILKELFSTM